VWGAASILSTFKNKEPIVCSSQDQKYVCVEYSHTIEHGLNKELRRHGIKLAFKTTNRTRSTLACTRQSQEKYSKTGTYKIKCGDCDSFYIGQTGRPFRIRYNEHRPNIKNNKQSSTFAQHLLDKKHTMNNINTGMDVLHYSRKGHKLNTLEEFEIYKHFTDAETKDLILNEKLQFKSNSIFNSIIRRVQTGSADRQPAKPPDIRTAGALLLSTVSLQPAPGRP